MALKQFSIKDDNITGKHSATPGDSIEIIGFPGLNIRIDIQSGGGKDMCAALFGSGACPITVGAKPVILRDAPPGRYTIMAVPRDPTPTAQADCTIIGTTGELNVGSGNGYDDGRGQK